MFELDTSLISIHAPREGSDFGVTSPDSRLQNFYPRSPRGERPKDAEQWAGPCDFYPRSPRGERQKAARVFTGIVKFLSTLPARGATNTTGLSNRFVYISIHAPREGSDL